MTILVDATHLPCTSQPEVYLDERIHAVRDPACAEPASNGALDQVRRTCAACPALIDCLYRSVVQVDVYGYAACTTSVERQQIREMLGLQAVLSAPEPAGARSGSGPIDHETVLAMRKAHPNDTFAQLADRLGCSLSTVKRHMRRARLAQERVMVHQLPTVDEVLDCFDRVVAPL